MSLPNLALMNGHWWSHSDQQKVHFFMMLHSNWNDKSIEILENGKQNNLF
jgi:hypothetical protein